MKWIKKKKKKHSRLRLCPAEWTENLWSLRTPCSFLKRWVNIGKLLIIFQVWSCKSCFSEDPELQEETLQPNKQFTHYLHSGLLFMKKQLKMQNVKEQLKRINERISNWADENLYKMQMMRQAACENVRKKHIICRRFLPSKTSVLLIW